MKDKYEVRKDSKNGEWIIGLTTFNVAIARFTKGITTETLDNFRKLLATNDSKPIDFTPFMPAHGNYGNCCGIFDLLTTDKGFVCNECGMNLNELIDGLEKI